MTFWRSLLAGLRRLLWRSRAERDLDAEVRHYLEMSAADHARSGLSPDEAARAARVEMGSVEAAREHVRSSGWENVFDTLWRDAAYALRMLRRSPSFTAVAVSVVALGIGINTAIFSIINAVLFRPLPVRAPDELAFIYSPDPGVPTLGAYEHALQLAANTDLFTGVVLLRGDLAALGLGGDVEILIGESVSTNYFEVLGVGPTMGRGLTPDLDDDPGADPVIVISDSLWRRRFNADRDVVGRRVALGDSTSSEPLRSYTVVGVMGPEFTGVSNAWSPVEYWVPLLQRAEHLWGPTLYSGKRSVRSVPVASAIARMRSGVTLEQVQAFASVWRQNVFRTERNDRQYGAIASSSRRVRLPFDAAGATPSRLGAGLMTVAALVLVIGVANLVGLLMARGVVRRGETAIRLTLGAGRWRVARQLIVEGLTIAALGGALGVVVSRWLITTLLDHMPAGVSRAYSQQVSLGVPLDLSVILFTILITAVVGILIGVAPVRQASTMNLTSALSGASFSASRPGRARLRHWIVIPQVAVSLALLLVAGVAVRALLKVALVPPGYEPDRAAYVQREQVRYPWQGSNADRQAFRARLDIFTRRLLDIAASSPGIQSAALTSALPTRPGGSSVITRDDFAAGATSSHAQSAWVSPGYFEVLGIPLRRGRTFDSRDREDTAKVAAVDEALAARLWPGKEAVGQHLAFYSSPAGPGVRTRPPVWMEVVGVVGAVRGPLSEGGPHAFAYVPLTQGQAATSAYSAYVFGETLIARGHGTNAQTIQTLRDAVAQADPEIGVIQSRMISDLINEQRYPRRLAAGLLGFSGLVGLLLASVGLYGVVSYSVAQRVRELGIRAALGADRSDIARLVVKEGLRVAAVGSVLGFVLAYIGIRVTSHLVLPIPSMDGGTLIAAPLVLTAVILTACYIPARRAARVDPMVVLRTQ